MRGQIISYSLQSNTGIVLGSDDKRYTFTNLDWKSAGIPELGMEIDFVCAGEAANQLYSLNFPKKSGDIEKSDEDGVIYQKEGNFFSWFVLAFKNYAKFSGRSTRQEFWMFYLVHILVLLILSFIRMINPTDPIFSILIGLSGGLYYFIVIIPTFSLTCRRLHDIGRSGWWQVAPYGINLLLLLMAIGFMASSNQGMMLAIMIAIFAIASFLMSILLLVWYCTRGNVGKNKYGNEIRWK